VTDIRGSSLGEILDYLVPSYWGSLILTPLPFFQGRVEISREGRISANGSGGGFEDGARIDGSRSMGLGREFAPHLKLEVVVRNYWQVFPQHHSNTFTTILNMGHLDA
jgi:hypothetical protein